MIILIYFGRQYESQHRLYLVSIYVLKLKLYFIKIKNKHYIEM